MKPPSWVAADALRDLQRRVVDACSNAPGAGRLKAAHRLVTRGACAPRGSEFRDGYLASERKGFGGPGDGPLGARGAAPCKLRANRGTKLS